MDLLEIDPKLFITCRLCLEDIGVYQIVPTVQQQIKYCFDINVSITTYILDEYHLNLYFQFLSCSSNTTKGILILLTVVGVFNSDRHIAFIPLILALWWLHI